MQSEKRAWKCAALLVVAYAVVLIIITLFHRWWSGEWDQPRQMIRFLGRLVGCAAIAWGLLTTQKWAYWIALIGATAFTALGAFGLVGAVRFNMFGDRPYPAIDLALIGIATLICLATVINLLLPSSRRALK